MQKLGATPTDVLSRQPYFDWHYTAEVNRLVNLAADQGVAFAPDLARQMEAKARNYALGESKRLLYDLAESSELAHTLRFVSPFFSAWQEVLSRWTSIAVDNPAFVARMHEVWRAPERAGLVRNGAPRRAGWPVRRYPDGCGPGGGGPGTTDSASASASSSSWKRTSTTSSGRRSSTLA